MNSRKKMGVRQKVEYNLQGKIMGIQNNLILEIKLWVLSKVDQQIRICRLVDQESRLGFERKIIGQVYHD